MPEWNKPLPSVVGETKPYWDSCKSAMIAVNTSSTRVAYVLTVGQTIFGGLNQQGKALYGHIR